MPEGGSRLRREVRWQIIRCEESQELEAKGEEAGADSEAAAASERDGEESTRRSAVKVTAAGAVSQDP
eukprot:4182-Rhodomonas_salina.1